MAATSNRPPGPRGKPLVGVALELRKHGLNLLARCAREYGDLVYLPLAFGQTRLLVSHPDLIEQVLVVQQHKFHKSALSKVATGRLLGNGLLNSEGDFWRRQRRLAQPAFQKTRVNEYAATMVEHALAYTARWREGEVRDIADEMSRLTCGIAVKTLFGIDLGPEADRVGESLTNLMRFQIHRIRSPLRIPENFPTPANRRANAAFQYLDSLVYRIIEERRARGADGNDLLSRLISAMDEDGTQMTPRQLRDETMTLFLAGHETTALTLSWTWYALARNPQVAAALVAEVDRVVGSRRPMVHDLPRLRTTERVVQESMRLYPPAYIVGREAIEDCEVMGYRVPAGM